MAHIANNLTGIRHIELFAGLPRPPDVDNIYPRARVTFRAGVTIAAKIATNTQTTRIQLDLPANYSYTMEHMEMAMSSALIADADQWEDLQTMTLQSSWAGGAYDNTTRSTFKSQGDAYYVDATQGLKTWELQDPFNEVFFLEESNPRAFVYITDADAVNATAACALSYLFSFLMYDLEQAFHVRVNAPMPVNQR